MSNKLIFLTYSAAVPKAAAILTPTSGIIVGWRLHNDAKADTVYEAQLSQWYACLQATVLHSSPDRVQSELAIGYSQNEVTVHVNSECKLYSLLIINKSIYLGASHPTHPVRLPTHLNGVTILGASTQCAMCFTMPPLYLGTAFIYPISCSGGTAVLVSINKGLVCHAAGR
jgi:hypothetical protein